MEFNDAFSLLYIAAMMVLGFFFIYSLLMKGSRSRKLLYLISYLLVYMSIVTVSASYLVFWNGNIFAGTAALIIGAVLFLPVAGSGNADIEWRKSLKHSMVLVSSLLVLELAMGFFYASVFMPHNANALVMAVNNPDFAAMMAVDAIFFFMISEKRKSAPEVALLTFAFSMALMPDFYLAFNAGAILASIILSASVMAVNIVLLYVLQLRRKTLDIQVLAVVLAGSDLLMMIGLSSYAISGDLYGVTAAMIFSMISYFILVTYRIEKKQVLNTRRFAFLLLVLVNGAELTMSFADTSLGAVLSNGLFPAVAGSGNSFFSTLAPGMVKGINFSNPFWWLFPFSPNAMGKMAFHAGISAGAPFAWFWSSFMIIMTTTMSPFYAIMMGSEMSYLVFERYRKSRTEGVKKWALAIIAGIPFFVILIPFYTPYYVFGMSGMLFEVYLTAFLVSVIAVLAATALFGRRVQCNLVCMAAHMWTNTYYDQFRPGKSSSLWNYARWFFFSLMIIFFSVFLLQQAGLVHALKIGMVTLNPLDFYGMFILNYTWWFFYFLTPVFGTYSCARQGWCGFGTLAGIFNKFFFRIKAVDTNVCSTCETRSCEKSCPTVIPVSSDIMKKGYTNRIACIGCGNCVESCDFQNLNISDVRNSRIWKRADPDT